MNSKLTLSIDKKVIDDAKRYAKKNNRSLSNLVENFLKSISAYEKIEQEKKTHPVVQSLRGAFKVPDDFNYDEALKEMKENRLKEKRLL